MVDSRVEFGVDTCHHPPGIRLTVYDSAKQTLFHEAIYNGSHLVGGDYLPFSLNVTVLHPSHTTISVEVKIYGMNICEMCSSGSARMWMCSYASAYTCACM